MCAPAWLPLQVISRIFVGTRPSFIYIVINFSMEVFYLMMGFKKVEDLSKGGRRGQH